MNENSQKRFSQVRQRKKLFYYTLKKKKKDEQFWSSFIKRNKYGWCDAFKEGKEKTPSGTKTDYDDDTVKKN